MVRLLFLFILFFLPLPTTAISNETLVEAFSSVFSVHDVILDPSARVVERVMRELDVLGVSRGGSLCALDDKVAANILMLAALGNLQLGLKDGTDWSVVVADVTTGQLVRARSFSAVRFAVLEGMLLIAIVALGRAIWMKTQ